MSGDRTLHVKKLATLYPACDSGQHIHHPGLTCPQADAQIAAEEAFWKEHWARLYAATEHTPMADIPPALRGPNWPGPAA